MNNKIESNNQMRLLQNENHKLAIKSETFAKVIDCQQKKLDNLRTAPNPLQEKYNNALEALAAERVKNAALTGQVQALKDKRKNYISPRNQDDIAYADRVFNEICSNLKAFLDNPKSQEDYERRRADLYFDLLLNMRSAASRYRDVIKDITK